MAFEGRYRETQRGGGFGGGATSAEPSENDTATVSEIKVSYIARYYDTPSLLL